NIRVLNNSYGGSGKSLTALDAILQLNSAGILFVAAAGNEATDNFSFTHFPSNYDAPNVIAVASTNSPDGLSGFSNFGARVVSMGAPGSGILSTTPNNTYSIFSGTSMATPHVAGAAALVCAANSNITLSQLRGVLAFTGDRIAALDGKTTTGRRLNVSNAVASALENDATPPTVAGNFRLVGQNGRSVSLAWTAPGDDGSSGTASDYDLFFVNPTTQVKTLLPTTLIPQPGGSQQSVAVDVPFRNFSGTIQLRTYDNAGNSSDASISVTIPVNSGSDPYTVALSDAPGVPPTTGTSLVTGDDKYVSYNLPFAFPFYGVNRNSLTVSTNGTLYFSTPPRRDNGDADDAGSSIEGLQGQTMIAGLWDDIDINPSVRPDSGVFVTGSDASHIVFRWQGVPCNPSRTTGACTGGNPINFEIELRSDGTIQMRYGQNANMFPVVGISGGEPEAYVAASHTSETQPINLTNAQTVTFAPRANVPDTPAVLAFQTSSLSANESEGRITVTIQRTGNTQNAASINVQTVDNPAAVRCDDTTTMPGVAFARCDYATTVATLNFGPNETTKTVAIPLIDDGYVEPTETFGLTLSNPSGNNTLGAQTTMTLNILNTDQAGQPNPIFSTSFFVRQQYLDFLSREPEAGEPWSAILNNCSDVNNNPACDRLTVSKSFFGSPEFRLKGFYVYRFYRLSFDRLPLYTEITPDMSSVTGATEAEVYQKKAAFADNWVQRPSFRALYDSTTAEDFVNTLMNRFALPSITTPDPAAPDGSVKLTLTRAELTSRLNAGTLTRAQVVRAIADSDQVAAIEYTRAYVSMQYFGYLRRDPDAGGFNDWLNYLNANPTDDRTMVNGFANSVEYRLRFGQTQ
ncbi:MAG: S8 family serine peptidase, partial [Acidobacteriota bacterium]|nr:S8 family serine peptidase [Acidobacteriota bacterium]